MRIPTGVRLEIETAQISSYHNAADFSQYGFFQKGGTSAAFDQQPVQVCAMVSACLVAQIVTGEGHWIQKDP